MNIVVVYGQNNKGNTYKLTRLLLDSLGNNGSTVTELFPKDYVKDFCTGCTSCFFNTENTCPHAGIVQATANLIDEADLLIFSSSCYVMNMTGSMKNFFDHFGYRFMVHRPSPKMFSKQAVVLSTAAGAGMWQTVKLMAINPFHWGVPSIWKYGLRINASSFDEIENKRKVKIKKRIEKIAKGIQKNNSPKPKIKTKILFSFIKLMHKNNNGLLSDKLYWQKQGWIK